jgi:hypothetical protein
VRQDPISLVVQCVDVFEKENIGMSKQTNGYVEKRRREGELIRKYRYGEV